MWITSLPFVKIFIFSQRLWDSSSVNEEFVRWANIKMIFCMSSLFLCEDNVWVNCSCVTHVLLILENKRVWRHLEDIKHPYKMSNGVNRYLLLYFVCSVLFMSKQRVYQWSRHQVNCFNKSTVSRAVAHQYIWVGGIQCEMFKGNVTIVLCLVCLNIVGTLTKLIRSWLFIASNSVKDVSVILNYVGY